MAVAVLLIWIAAAGHAETIGPYKEGKGPYRVEIARIEWFDASRNRLIPAKIYYPGNSSLPHPVVIYSHGLGSSRESGEYVGRHWASYGYVSVHIQHEGSDSALWKNKKGVMVLVALMKAARDPSNARNRPLDVKFVIDRLADLDREEPPFRGMMNLEQIGMAGHSFGAWTALVVAGQTVKAGDGTVFRLADSRVKAIIPMSPPVPWGQGQGGYGEIRVPAFHMTGTLDESPVGETPVVARRIPFERIAGADQYLVTFREGDHGIFSGRKRGRWRGEKDELFQRLIRTCTVAFWDAYLQGNNEARAWLTDGGFESVLGEDGVFEKKLKKPEAEKD